MDASYGSQTQPQYYQYGAPGGEKTPFVRGQRSRLNLVAICQCLFVPWLLFCVVYAVMSFSLHYTQPGLCYLIVACCGLAVLASGFLAGQAVKRRATQPGSQQDPTWLIFLFFTMLVAWSGAFVLGDLNFWYNMQPYYDIQNLNTYPSVSPASTRGQQLMDAGRVFFTAGTKLDLTKSMGFRNLDLYCVAPISTGDAPLASYDFWAVGLNCCSGTSADFHCGEFNNPRASAGLRLMRDDQRAFFRLAVQQAEAAYSIKAIHPLFFYWMQDPVAEMNSYQDDGFKYYLLGMFTMFSFQLFCVVVATIAFSKMGN